MGAFEWSPGGCCCGGIWDFYGPPHAYGDSSTTDSTAAINGFVMTRVASLFDLVDGEETQTSSSGTWEVDCTDFGSSYATVWSTRSYLDPSDKSTRVWYFCSEDSAEESSDGADRWNIIEVECPFNGTPTIVDEYSYDWRATGTLGGAGFGYVFSADTGYRYPCAAWAVTTPIAESGLRKQISDGSDVALHPSHANATDRTAYVESDYMYHGSGLRDSTVGLGIRYTTAFTGATLDSWEMELVLGEVDYTASNATVSPDTTLFTRNSFAFNTVGGGFNMYDVDVVSCEMLDSLNGKHCGIFETGRRTIRSRADPGKWDLVTGFTFAPDTANDKLYVLDPSGSLIEMAVKDVSTPFAFYWDGVRPRWVTGAVGDSSSRYFMTWQEDASLTNGLASYPGLKLSLMSGATPVWTIDYYHGNPVIQVSDRFVYVRAAKESDLVYRTYAVDYEGNEFETFSRLTISASPDETNSLPSTRNNTYRIAWDSSSKPVSRVIADYSSSGGSHYSNWAVVTYSDNLSPTTGIMGRYT